MASHHEQREYMVYADIATLKRAVDRLYAQIQQAPEGTQFPEWWKSNLTIAANKVATLEDALASYAEGAFGQPYGFAQAPKMVTRHSKRAQKRARAHRFHPKAR